MTFPTPYLAQHYPYTGDPAVVDEIGNVIDTWAEKPKPVAIQGWETTVTERLGNSEQGEIINAVCQAPPDWVPGIHDRVQLPDGLLYEVIGINYCTNGFHGWRPGNEILFKRSTGII